MRKLEARSPPCSPLPAGFGNYCQRVLLMTCSYHEKKCLKLVVKIQSIVSCQIPFRGITAMQPLLLKQSYMQRTNMCVLLLLVPVCSLLVISPALCWWSSLYECFLIGFRQNMPALIDYTTANWWNQ